MRIGGARIVMSRHRVVMVHRAVSMSVRRGLSLSGMHVRAGLVSETVSGGLSKGQGRMRRKRAKSIKDGNRERRAYP